MIYYYSQPFSIYLQGSEHCRTTWKKSEVPRAVIGWHGMPSCRRRYNYYYYTPCSNYTLVASRPPPPRLLRIIIRACGAVGETTVLPSLEMEISELECAAVHTTTGQQQQELAAFPGIYTAI